MARFLPDVAMRSRRLIVVCPEPMRELLRNVSGVDEIRLAGTLPTDSFDLYLPLMSLGHVLEISDDTCGRGFPYLSVPDHVTVPALPGSKMTKVGICWRGSPGHRNDHQRSCPLQQWRTLTIGVDADFYSLNIELSREEKSILGEQGIHELGGELTDFARTAAYMQQLDLIIAVDTACAHLGGALDIPTWILVSANPDWRWGLKGGSTPWYRSVRIFRQQTLDDWPALLDEVGNELKSWT